MRWWVGMLGAALLLVGCASMPEAAPDAVIVPQADCAEVGTPGRIPGEFEPVSVIVCDAVGTVTEWDGIWSGEATRHLGGDLAPLVDALNQADDPRWPGPCTAHMVIVPQLWLVDASGSAVQVRYPRDGCGQPKTEGVNAALALLSVTTSTVDRRELTESSAAVEAGCSTRWMPIRIAQPGELPGVDLRESIQLAEPGGASTFPLAPLEPPSPNLLDGMRLCHYAADANLDDQFFLGTFTSGSMLGAEDGRRILAAADYQVMPTIQCLHPAEAFVVAHPIVAGQDAGPAITIELDGCKRLFGTAGFTLVSDELLSVVEPRAGVSQ